MNKLDGVSTPLEYKQHFQTAILYKCNIHIALNNNYMNNNMTFLYPSVEHATSILIRRISSSEVLPIKELLVSSGKPNRFYQVIDHKAGDLVICIDQQCDIVSLHVNDVRVVNGYE